MSDITIKDGYMYGGWRAPKNLWTGMKTSIHDDNTAKSVGMRGGTITGTTHISMFAPLMLEIFGDRWFEKGNLSMYYTFATTHLEEVRAVVKIPPEDSKDVQVEARVEMKDGQVVETGTVAVGEPEEQSYIQALELKNSKPEELRILSSYKVGNELQSKDWLLTQEDVDKGLMGITDHLNYYKGKSPWGKSILSPSAMFGVMALGSDRLDTERDQGVPFFGATEIRNINGPVLVGVPYKVTGKIVCVGMSRKTEYYWHDSFINEKESGKLVASMRHLNRFMKAGSPLYKDNT